MSELRQHAAVRRGASVGTILQEDILAFIADGLLSGRIRAGSVSKIVAAARWLQRVEPAAVPWGFDGEWRARLAAVRRGAVRANPPAAASRPATPLTLAVAEVQLARVAHAARSPRPMAVPAWDRASGVSMHLVEPEAAWRILGLVLVGKAFFLRKKEAATIETTDISRLTLRGVELARCLLHRTKMSGRRAGPTDFIDPSSGAEFSFSADSAAIAWLDARLARSAPATDPLLPAVRLRRRPVREGAGHVWTPAETAGASARWEPAYLSEVLSAFFSPGGAVVDVRRRTSSAERFSLRAGAAVDALEHRGQPIEWVAKVGRWASTQTIAAHYHRLVGSAFPLAVAERHARAREPRDDPTILQAAGVATGSRAVSNGAPLRPTSPRRDPLSGQRCAVGAAASVTAARTGDRHVRWNLPPAGRGVTARPAGTAADQQRLPRGVVSAGFPDRLHDRLAITSRLEDNRSPRGAPPPDLAVNPTFRRRHEPQARAMDGRR